MKVRLTRKHAERIDGIDLRLAKPGDLLDLSAAEAHILVAEEWAVRERRERQQPKSPMRRADDHAQKTGRSGPRRSL